jgi:8-amino-7-oxononanoate synthase
MQSDTLSTWKDSLKARLRSLEERSQRRSLSQIHGVNFCSNDYLGLATHPDLREKLLNAVLQSASVGGTGSRLLSGQFENWRALEEKFAEFAATESALFFTSGYAANLGLLSSLVGKDDTVFSDALNHASLIDGIRLSGARKVIYPHLDLQVLESALRQESGAPWRKIIVTESVFSIDGDVAPLEKIAALAEKYDAAMIIDEAHATAVHGPGGRGIAAQANVVSQALAIVHTCGKSLGCAGAFVCGPAVLKDFLINHARTFIFSTALPPYLADQIAAALQLASSMDRERHQLLARATYFKQALRGAGFDTAGSASQIVPVVLGKNEAALGAAEFLQRDGFAVRAIRPPTVPEGRALLRFSLTSRIPELELSRLVGSLVAWRSQQPASAVAKRA